MATSDVIVVLLVRVGALPFIIVPTTLILVALGCGERLRCLTIHNLILGGHSLSDKIG
jgi:hypothetical protein